MGSPASDFFDFAYTIPVSVLGRQRNLVEARALAQVVSVDPRLPVGGAGKRPVRKEPAFVELQISSGAGSLGE